MRELDSLTPKKHKALVALMAAPSVPAAAEVVGISAGHLYRWLAEPEFKTAFRVLRREALAQASAKLQQLASKAADALENVLDSPDSTASSRVRAASTVLDFAYRAAELEDIEDRLAELERQEAARNAARR